MSVQGNEKLTEIVDSKFVYAYTGMADPDKIYNIFTILMNFSIIDDTYSLIHDSLISDGIALPLLLKELNNILL